jgi:nicotinamidase-related amidase
MALGDASEGLPEAAGHAALLLIDVINPLDFQGAEDLLGAALALAEPIARMRDAADAAGVPVIYVNDNQNQWHSQSSRLIDTMIEEDRPGRPLAEQLRPREEDFFVIKPQFSGFYATNLPVLLPRLGVTRLILAGFAADICVLFTAADAHMREYELWVPSDLVAGEDDRRTRWALDIMRASMRAETRPTGQLSLGDWLAADGPD